jgi:hypothetical protein
VATTIWADGEYDEAEKIAVGEIADAFELNAEEFAAAIEGELAVIEPMDEEGVNNYILEHSAEVDEEEAEMLLQAVLQVCCMASTQSPKTGLAFWSSGTLLTKYAISFIMFVNTIKKALRLI